MPNYRQKSPHIKDVGGKTVTERELADNRSPAQEEAERRAGEPAIRPDPDRSVPGGDAATVSANKRGGGSHGGRTR